MSVHPSGKYYFKTVDRNCPICDIRIIFRSNEDLVRKTCSRACSYKLMGMIIKEQMEAGKRLMPPRMLPRKQKYCKKCNTKMFFDTTSGFCKVCFNKNKFCSIKKECKGCGINMIVQPARVNEKVFCTKECGKRYRDRVPSQCDIVFNCAFCSKECIRQRHFITTKTPCCSIKCYHLYRKISPKEGKSFKLTLRKLVRRCPQYIEWKKKILVRDKFRCQKCDCSGSLHVHHIESFATIFREFLSLNNVKEIGILYDLALKFNKFWNISNGISICIDCHQLIHPRKFLSALKRR